MRSRVKRLKCENDCEKNKHGYRSERMYDKNYLVLCVIKMKTISKNIFIVKTKLLFDDDYDRRQSIWHDKNKIQHHTPHHSILVYTRCNLLLFTMVLRLACRVRKRVNSNLIGKYKNLFHKIGSYIWSISVGYDVK